MRPQKSTITASADEARRYICDEFERQIRAATFAEIVESDKTAEGWIAVDDIAYMVFVDGEALVSRDAHGRVAIWSAKSHKFVDARYTSYRDRHIAVASIGGKSNRMVNRGGAIEQSSELDDFAAYLEAVGR